MIISSTFDSFKDPFVDMICYDLVSPSTAENLNLYQKRLKSSS